MPVKHFQINMQDLISQANEQTDRKWVPNRSTFSSSSKANKTLSEDGGQQIGNI